jgi:predicted Zn-dependent peptidase
MYHNEGREPQLSEKATINLFNEYFGGGMNGIVFQELREARGLAYNAGANYGGVSKKGDKEMFFTHIISQNDKMMDCIRQFHQILDVIPQSEGAFRIAKEAVTKKIASNRTTKSELLSAWLEARDLGIDYDQNERIYRALDKVTLQDIVRFEQQHMAHKTWRYVILGNEKELDMKALEKIGPIRRLTPEETFGY